MKSIFLFSLIVSISFSAFSQNKEREICGTDIYNEELYKTYPLLKEQFEKENLTRDLTPYRTQKREAVRIIPVVFHIIHQGGSENIPDEDIQGVLKRINEDFRKLNSDTTEIRQIFKNRTADMNIEFRLAKIDPYGNCTNGITRTYSTLTENARDNVKSLKDENNKDLWWNNMKYLNVWVVKSIYNSSGVGTILGYSYFPNIALQNPKLDGIVIMANVCNYSGRTLTHELGHYFGLYHTFQNSCGSDCKTTGDQICDTPPVYEDTYGCDKTKNSCSNDSPNEPDMTENHMDYTTCRVMYTKGQKEVVDYYLASQYRNNLYKATNLTATGTDNPSVISCIPVADFELNKYAYCSGSPVSFTDKSLGPENMQYTWYLPGSSSEKFIGRTPVVTYTNPGKYNVKLTVKSNAGSDSLTKNSYVFVYPDHGEAVTFKEDFENNSFASNYWYVDPALNGIEWKRTAAAAYESSKSFYLNNFSNTTEREYSFILPPLDLSQVSAPYLYFVYAHARKSDQSKDLLRIYVSTDCGNNWSLRDIVNQIKLPTSPNFVTTQFIPATVDLWKEKFVDISNYYGQKNVLIKIGFFASGGNNFYIDNLKVYSSVSMNEANLITNGLSVYPNPANSILNIDFFTLSSSEIVLNIADLTGNIVKKQIVKVHSGENNLQLDVSEIISEGMYFVELIDHQQIHRKKVMIIR